MTSTGRTEQTASPQIRPWQLTIAYRNRFVQHPLMKCFLLLSQMALPLSVFAEGGLPEKPYIYVKGTAEVQKPADVIICQFDLVATAPEQPKANEEVQSKANKILMMLKERKIVDNDVIAENIQSHPEFENETYGHPRGKLIGYTVSRPFEIKIRDLAVFPPLVDALIALGGVEFSETRGGLTNQRQIEEQLIDQALTNARERADKTANAMGVKIESVFAISTVSFPQIQSDMFPVERVTVTGSNIPTARYTTPEYRFAPITVSQEVHVIYLISPVK
jgi:uncharacterized protein